MVIQKTDTDNYKLNLIYGDFIQMEGNQNNTQTIELAINDITIKQQDKSQPLNFKFVKNGKNQIFQNNGANIVVTKNNGKENSTTISNFPESENMKLWCFLEIILIISSPNSPFTCLISSEIK